MNINEAVERLTKAGYVAVAQNDGKGIIRVQDPFQSNATPPEKCYNVVYLTIAQVLKFIDDRK